MTYLSYETLRRQVKPTLTVNHNANIASGFWAPRMQVGVGRGDKRTRNIRTVLFRT